MGRTPRIRKKLLTISVHSHIHNRAVNPKAATPRVITAWNIRPSTDRAAIAAFALDVLLPALPDALEGLPLVVPELSWLVLGVVPARDEEGATLEDDAVMADDTADVIELDIVLETDADEDDEAEAEPDAPDGRDVALAGLASAPTPQGIAWPSG